jgi:hypothetical protein
MLDSCSESLTSFVQQCRVICKPPSAARAMVSATAISLTGAAWVGHGVLLVSRSGRCRQWRNHPGGPGMVDANCARLHARSADFGPAFERLVADGISPQLALVRLPEQPVQNGKLVPDVARHLPDRVPVSRGHLARGRLPSARNRTLHTRESWTPGGRIATGVFFEFRPNGFENRPNGQDCTIGRKGASGAILFKGRFWTIEPHTLDSRLKCDG